MPLLQKTSAVNRSTALIEVGDTPDEDAAKYLISKGMKKEDAHVLVEYFGGRFVSLNARVLINKVIQKRGIPLDTEKVKKDITQKESEQTEVSDSDNEICIPYIN